MRRIENMEHGTRSCYVHRRCRCDECRAVQVAYQKAWNDAHPGYQVANASVWAKANVKRDRANRKAWRAANRERERERRARWAAAHPEYRREAGKAWVAANRERSRLHKRKGELIRRARKRAAFVEAVDPMVVYERDAGICQICDKVIKGKWEIDHVIPLARGGEHSYANVQLAHERCNRKKWMKVPS